jgi:signal transduction histidine kinase
MALLFSGGTLVTAVLGLGIFRVDWARSFPQLFWSLLAGYLLAGLLTFSGVWATARLMFLDQHDLLLAAALLLFATGNAVSLGYLLASGTAARVQVLARAAEQVAEGDLQVRVLAAGRDELAGLARAFNTMTEQLAEAAERRKEVESLRRDLISWVGHDLRTPLASVRVIIDALADGMIDDPETVRRYLATAQRDIDSLASLIDDLFLLNQLDSGRLPLDRQHVSLADLISDTIQSFSVLAEKTGVNLSGMAAPDVDPVLCDAQQLERVLANLVDNALRHSPRGGWVKLRAWSAGRMAQVEVTDDGPGIAPADLPHVFDRFYRGEKSRNRQDGGAGLGLAIAQGIVDAHGGSITVRNVPEGGAAFSFSIPRFGEA